MDKLFGEPTRAALWETSSTDAQSEFALFKVAAFLFERKFSSVLAGEEIELKQSSTDSAAGLIDDHSLRDEE